MRLLQIIFFLAFSQLLQATHIVGGVADYKIIDISDPQSTLIEVTFQLYRDAISAGADFDRDAEFGIYRKNTSGDYNYYDSVIADPSNIKPCITSNILSLESADYILDITLEKGFDYIIAYQRCCRPTYISNILNPGDNGIAIQLEIYSSALEVDFESPSFEEIPFVQTKPGEPINYQLPLISEDISDITTYFSSGLSAGGTFDSTGSSAGAIGCCNCVRPLATNCPPPYNLISYSQDASGFNPFGELNDVTLSTEGLITGIINFSSVYQYGIIIESRNNGILMSKQLLDNNVFVSLTSSVEDLTSFNVDIYPNPVSQRLTITNSSEYLSLFISDMNGKQVLATTSIEMGTKSIDLDQLAPGIYFATLQNVEGHRQTKKFVVE